MLSRVIKAIAIIVVFILLPAASLAQKTHKQKQPQQLTPKEMAELSKNGKRPGAAKTFHIARIEHDPNRFSVLLSDENSRMVNAHFTMSQLLLFEAVAIEAQKFAETDEAAGTDKAVITRFYDKKAPELVIDVAKKGTESQFFITIQGFNGKLTVDGGKIKRAKKDEEPSGIFYVMLKKIDGMKSGDPFQ